jgi:hypothetical protein
MQKEIITISYDLCPSCNGQGLVSRPPLMAGDVFNWPATSGGQPITFKCRICDGKGIILPHIVNGKDSQPTASAKETLTPVYPSDKEGD